MSFNIFTYYTKNTPYKEEALSLKKDCKQFGVPFSCAVVKSQGKWVENTMIKPKIILKGLSSSKHDCMIWIDADARLKSYPSLFDKLDQLGVDFAVFQMGSKSRITSGTIFMRNNKRVKAFIKDWMLLCKNTTIRLGDQHCLRDLINMGGYNTHKIVYKPLPYSYCFIFDDSLRQLAPHIPPLQGNPVVVHTQASRRYRGAV